MNMNVYTYMYNFLKIYFKIQRNDTDKMSLAPPGREIENGIRGSTQGEPLGWKLS